MAWWVLLDFMIALNERFSVHKMSVPMVISWFSHLVPPSSKAQYSPPVVTPLLLYLSFIMFLILFHSALTNFGAQACFKWHQLANLHFWWWCDWAGKCQSWKDDLFRYLPWNYLQSNIAVVPLIGKIVTVIVIFFVVMWFPPENVAVTFSLGCEKYTNGTLLPLKFQFNHMELRWRQKDKLGEHFQYSSLSFLCFY